jgi:hypothetical protein
VILGPAFVALLIAASDVEVQLADGARVPMRLMSAISSETSKRGDAVRLEVVEDITIERRLIIEKGAPATGYVVEAIPHKLMGPAGRLVFTVNETRAVDGQPVRLRSSPTKSAEGQVPAGIVVTMRGLLRWAGAGDPFDAFVDGDQLLTVRPREVRSPREAPTEVLTNEDVLRLIDGGLGEEVIIAKIQRSRTGFRVRTDDLIQLKKAGVSDRILTAMIGAATHVAPRREPQDSPRDVGEPEHPREAGALERGQHEHSDRAHRQHSTFTGFDRGDASRCLRAPGAGRIRPAW